MAGNLEYPTRQVDRIKRRISRSDVDMLKTGLKAGNIIQRHIRKQFATKGAWMGTPWKPLKPATIKEKRKLGFGNRMLVRTGDMKASLTKSPMDIEWFTHTRGTFGSDEMKAIWQHFGTRRRGKRAIPPRTLLKLTPALKTELLDLIRRQTLGVRR